MSTTIAHPQSVQTGPSGKTVAAFLIGAVLAAAVGYGVDQVSTKQAAELAADKAAAVARGEHMQSINDLGYLQPTVDPSAEEAAAQAAAARTDRMLSINEFGYGESITNEEAIRRGERMLEINSFGEEPAKLEGRGPKSPLVVE